MLILKSHHIFDSLAGTTFSGYLKVEGERITAILSERAAQLAIANGAKLLDYSQQMIVPGFIDAHTHFFLSALIHQKKIWPLVTASENDYAEEASRFSAYRGWTVAIGWYSSDWEVDQLPTKATLDHYFDKRPCAMVSGDAHTLWLNSAAMDKLAIGPATIPTDIGGEAVVENGQLTGVFFEALAIYYLGQILADYRHDSVQDYRSYMSYLNQFGITSCTDIALTGDSGDDLIYPEIYQQLQVKARPTMRVSLYPAMREDTRRILAMKETLTGNFVTLGGVKQFFDGVTSTRTALMMADYPDPNFPGEIGQSLIPIERLRDYILEANRLDLPMRIHVVGDRATHLALDYYAESYQRHPLSEGKYNTLEHLECVYPTDFSRLGQPQLVLSVQPSHVLVGYESLVAEVGPERLPYMFAFKSFIENHAILGFGTDTPVVLDVTPLESIYYAVFRKGMDGLPVEGVNYQEALTIPQALTAHTLGAAKAMSRTDIGQLGVGKLADFVILDHNILDDGPDALEKTRIIATYVGGQKVT
ncbi:amidohydrolase family protein [Vagococcus sp. BWB3-3]|uniref:Amidohydrolase family protein n=1 Tax=Vagococcus allomyrinae TaxID=2794353 RepID=A0A940SWA1_9ENTE|nr:amidohydrolase family protein [Vagococcus allomyrinae]MBP1041876.1 amidohydrolase family protein [Vagococcus allomyrinae]